jgi:hypothetical protein
MAFTMGFAAIDQLKWGTVMTPTAKSILNNLDVNWVFVDFVPAYVLLVLVSVAVFFTLTSRHGKSSAVKIDKSVDPAADQIHVI